MVFWKKKEESSALWECGKRGAFSKGGGQRWKTGAERPSRQRWRFPTAVHGPAFPPRSGVSGAELADARHELALGPLHFQRGFGIGLLLRKTLEFGKRHARPQETFAAGHLFEQF
jgi:hypothetical protein